MRNKGLIVLLTSVLFVWSGVASAKKPRTIEPRIDLAEGVYKAQTYRESGFIGVGVVTVDREQPINSGRRVELNPEYADEQIGWIEYRGTEYLVVLKNQTVSSLVRAAVELALEKSGYSVVREGQAGYGDVPKLDVNVEELWMWRTPIDDTRRSQFHFAMETSFSSEIPELQNMAAVQVQDFRNGSRTKNWKSYRNTVMHSMKAYIRNFNIALASSAAAAKNQVEED